MGVPLTAFTMLGLSRFASIDEIKSAYRRRALQLHPDRGGDHSLMANLNVAYEDAVQYATWRG
jgi:curved DNA-binding protein CbpA